MISGRSFSCAFVLAALLALTARATTVNDLARIRGQGESKLQGLGLVLGLQGTGDSGKELVVARPLAKVLENNGNAISSFKELASSKSAALVMVTCTIPQSGGRANDKFKVTVSTVNSATSLKGGTLYLTPLTGPYPGDPVFAMASGKLQLEDPALGTTAVVTDGAHLIRDILMQPVGDSFDLLIDPVFAGWAAAGQIAVAINAVGDPKGEPVAKVVDDRTIRVTIPDSERDNRAGFVGDVLSADVTTSLLGLPAQVVCNRRTGVIMVTGDVEISPGLIAHKDLVITTTTPPPQPTPAEPLVETSRFAAVETRARPSERAKLTDLVAAFKQLDVPTLQQIDILQTLHESGRLHAKFICDQ